MMGRFVQLVGLLCMGFGLLGIVLELNGNPALVALANPCIYGNAVPGAKNALGSAAPASTPTPGGVLQAAPVLTPPPAIATPVPTATPHDAKQLGSYPVFAPTESLSQPVATPTPTPLPAATATPTAAPSLPPCPSHTHRFFGEGPIEFSGTGALDVGTHINQSSEAGLTPTSISQNQYTAGMQFQISRRTDLASLVVSEALGEYNGTTNLSGLDIAYSTPKYIANYGQITGPADTQLSNGSFNQGLTFGIPRGRSEWDIIAARTTGINDESFRVGALRHSLAYPSGALLSQTLFAAFGEQGGNALTFDQAYTRFTARNSLRLELALTRALRIPTVPDGTRIAYALSDNITGPRVSTSLSYTAIPNGYVALGQVQYAQDQLQITQRRPFIGRGSIDFSYNQVRADTLGSIALTQSGVVNVVEQLGKYVNSQWLANISTESSGGDTQRQRQFSLSLGEQFHGLSLQETLGTTSTVDALAGDSLLNTYDVALSKAVLGGYLAISSDVERGHSYGFPTSQSDSVAAFTHPVGRKAQLSVSLEQLRNDSLGTIGQSTKEFTTTVSATRQFSPVVGLRLTYAKTHQSGTFGGTASYLNFDIVGPLSIGSAARYNGRPNPNLPATISGKIFYETPGGQYGILGTRGLSNVLVSLDGGLTQRTDATGSYEFRFVRPGAHIVSIAPGTLPAGTIADTTSQSLNVQGGQTITVDFQAGQFAGVGGTVTTLINGKETPVPGVLVQVDNKYRGYTGSDGTYEIGHLDSGKHTVEIDNDSLPATLAVKGESSHDVTVSTGGVTTQDFELVGLGSISGEVLFAGDGGLGDLIPAANVYVVADPGEHASITGEDGTFLIDNLPPGQYTLSLDQDTLPDGQSVIQGPDGLIDVEGGSAIKGIEFKLGPQAKMVVMGFGGGSSASVAVNFRPSKVPPNGAVEVLVTTDEPHARSVTAQSDLWGTLPLHFDKSEHAWVATIPIPQVENRDYPVHVEVKGPKSGSTDSVLTVSNSVPLVYAHGTPANPHPGQPVRVVARILAAHVQAGDLLTLDDGTSLHLPAPHGTIYAFSFTAKHALPYHGLIFTKNGTRVPFIIGP
jgi:hypothetical protein